MFFSAHARSVTILYRGETLEKSMSHYLVEQLATRANIHVLYRTEVVAAHGESSLEGIDVRDAATGEATSPRVGRAVHLHRRRRRDRVAPARDRARPEGLRADRLRRARRGTWQLDRDPYLLETSVPGIFACGDVRYSPVKRVAAAVGEGSMAIAFVHQYLQGARMTRTANRSSIRSVRAACVSRRRTSPAPSPRSAPRPPPAAPGLRVRSRAP